MMKGGKGEGRRREKEEKGEGKGEGKGKGKGNTCSLHYMSSLSIRHIRCILRHPPQLLIISGIPMKIKDSLPLSLLFSLSLSPQRYQLGLESVCLFVKRNDFL